MSIKCPCGDIDCEIYDGNAYPGRVIHCRLLSSGGKLTRALVKQAVATLRQHNGGVPIHVIQTAEILTDPDWRDWLKKI